MHAQVTPLRVAVFICGFFALWMSTWVVHEALRVAGLQMPLGSDANLAYWTLAKLMVWVVYPILFWRAPLPAQLRFIGLTHWRAGLVWGLGATALWVAVSYALLLGSGRSLGMDSAWPIFIYTVVLTPLFEEIMFRGYIQSLLRDRKMRFWYANLATSGLFVLIHCVGWSFQGSLWTNLLSILPLSLLMVSLVMGYVRERSGSLVSSILLHMGNNGFASLQR